MTIQEQKFIDEVFQDYAIATINATRAYYHGVDASLKDTKIDVREYARQLAQAKGNALYAIDSITNKTI